LTNNQPLLLLILTYSTSKFLKIKMGTRI